MAQQFCSFKTAPSQKKVELSGYSDDATILQKIFDMGNISPQSTFYQDMYSEEEIALMSKKVVTALLLSDPNQRPPSFRDVISTHPITYVLQRANNKNLTVYQVINEFPQLEGPTIGFKAFALSGIKRKTLTVDPPSLTAITGFTPVSIQSEISNDDARIRGQYESHVNRLIESGDENADVFMIIKSATNLSQNEKDERQNMIGEIVVGKYNNSPQLVHQKIDSNDLVRMSRSEYQAYINRLIRDIRLASSSTAQSLENRASETKYAYESISYQR